MAFAHKVIDRSGDPTVWITEDLEADPVSNDGTELAPRATRVVWKVIRPNASLVRVVAVDVASIQPGCAAHSSHHIQDQVPDDHLEEMRMQMQLDLLDNCSREMRLRFPQFDIEHAVQAVQQGDA